MHRLAAGLALAALLIPFAPARAADEGEARTGQKIYDDFHKRNQIVEHSRYNAVLDPIAARVAAAAQPMYGQPLRYYVIKGKEINAFAVPGGYMFIYQGLIDAVQTKEELAGVMCHETSHTLHHDATNLSKTALQRSAAVTALGLFVPGAGLAARLLGQASDFQMAHFSRKVETAADLTGADVCMQAGYNPYGLVWMMERFQQLAGSAHSLEMLSDHPRDDHRISDLTEHFKEKPDVFTGLRSDIAWGTPIAAAGDGTGKPSFPFVVCPRTKPNDARPAENFATWWGGLDAVGPFVAAAPVAARTARDSDRIEFPRGVQWYRSKEDLGGIVTGYDPAAQALATCADDASGSRMDVVAGVAPPEEKLPTLELSSLKTAAGVGLGSSLADVLAAYGPATPAHLADGRDVYLWERVAPNGDRSSVRVGVHGGAVVAYELRTRVGNVATPEPSPTRPAAAK